MQGEDEEDETTLGVAPHNSLAVLRNGVEGLRIAFGETLFFDESDAEVEQLVRAAGSVFESLGQTLDISNYQKSPVSWPTSDLH